MKILHLTLNKKWYDMIESGIKKEEYREIKKYWIQRLENKIFDVVSFRNGYRPNSRKMSFECNGIVKKKGNVDWGADHDTEYYVIILGNRILTGDRYDDSIKEFEQTDPETGEKEYFWEEGIAP